MKVNIEIKSLRRKKYAKKWTALEFKIESMIKFGIGSFKFDKMIFVDIKTSVILWCRDCGEYFEIIPEKHLTMEYGCRKCLLKKKIRNKLSEEEIRRRFKEIHGDKYGYEKVDFESREKQPIFCKICQEYNNQTIQAHLSGRGCKKCGEKSVGQQNKEKYSINTEEKFFKKAEEKYGHLDLFGYQFASFIDMDTPIKIWSNKYQVFFETTPKEHLRKIFKPDSNKIKKIRIPRKRRKHFLDFENFLKLVKEKFGNKFNYDKVIYIDENTPIEIWCNECQKFFWMKPILHFKSETGCRSCSNKIGHKKLELSSETIIERFNKVHGEGIYGYDRVHERKLGQSLVWIYCYTCQKYFQQSIHNHMQGKGCRTCGINNSKYTKEKFEKECNKVHGIGTFNYDHVIITDGLNSEVNIICNHCNREFKIIARSHRYGAGCPYCSISKGELKIKLFLEKYNIKYTFQKWFDDLRGKKERPLRFDFYLDNYNTCIEFQGVGHYEPIKFFGGEETFKNGKKNDKTKRNYCKKKNINLLEIKYTENIEEVLTNYLNNLFALGL